MALTKTWKHNGIKCTVYLLVTCDNRQCSCRSLTFEEAGQWYFNFTEWSVDRNPNLLGSKLEKGNTIVANFLHWIDFWNDLRLIHPLAVIGICMTQSPAPVRNLVMALFVEITFLSFRTGNYYPCIVRRFLHLQIPLTHHIQVYLRISSHVYCIHLGPIPIHPLPLPLNPKALFQTFRARMSRFLLR